MLIFILVAAQLPKWQLSKGAPYTPGIPNIVPTLPTSTSTGLWHTHFTNVHLNLRPVSVHLYCKFWCQPGLLRGSGYYS